jgi:hypothetical protein
MACIPGDQWLTGNGRVVDRRTGAPISGAVIRFYSTALPDTGVRASTDSVGGQLDSLSVEAPRYRRAAFIPSIMCVALFSIEIQLASLSAREHSRLLSEWPEASHKEPAE